LAQAEKKDMVDYGDIFLEVNELAEKGRKIPVRWPMLQGFS
jgi:hypothetical protein